MQNIQTINLIIQSKKNKIRLHWHQGKNTLKIMAVKLDQITERYAMEQVKEYSKMLGTTLLNKEGKPC